MKKFTFAILAAFTAVFAAPAFAADVMVASTMQRCTTNEECKLVTNSCADNCGFVPVNTANLPAVEALYQTRCGKAMSANPQCNMNPPISAACINSRCTIDYAYANNAGAKDYQSGAYPVPEAAVPSKVPAADYSNVNDRDGHFTAYNLPQGEVRQETVGQIVTKVYVPPSAPVSGGNYVPVTGMVPSAPATPQTAPVPAPNAIPAPVSAAPSAAPSAIPPAAVPTAKTHATPPVVTSPPSVPAMTPSIPNQVPTPPPAPVAAPQAYVPAPTVPTVPAPGLPPTPRAPDMIPAVGATGVPQAPAGSTPIPPSDLKPAPTFVPPAGTAVPVAPEDPGAPPPEGTTMIMPLPNGETATVGDATREGTKKSFNTAKPKKSSVDYN